MRPHDEQVLAILPAGAHADPGDDALLAERVEAEIAAGFRQLAGVERGISVFGSARARPGDPDYELARQVAARLGREGFAIITGGGPGIMEAANRGARDVGALSVGLPITERLNAYLDLSLRFRHFFTRKLMFVRYASAFVIFPGGFGTLDELFELASLAQSGKLSARSIVLVRRAYWEPLFEWLRGSVLAAGNISAADLELFSFADAEDEVAASVATSRGEDMTA
jgi:hypothetical protein